MSDNWLTHLRFQAGLTQEEVAKALGVSERTYRRWEADPETLPLWRIMRILVELDPEHEWVLVVEGSKRYLRQKILGM